MKFLDVLDIIAIVLAGSLTYLAFASDVAMKRLKKVPDPVRFALTLGSTSLIGYALSLRFHDLQGLDE